MESIGVADHGAGEYIDQTPSQVFPVYCRSGSDEIWPEPLWPLTVSAFCRKDSKVAEILAKTGFYRDSDFLDGGNTSFRGCFSGYMYQNLSLTRTVSNRSPHFDSNAVGELFMVDREWFPPHVPGPADESDIFLKIQMMASIQKLIRSRDRAVMEADRRAVVHWQHELANVAERDLLAITKLIPVLNKETERLYNNYLLGSAISGTAVRTLQTLCGRGFDDYSYFTKLISGIGEMEISEASLGLWDLASILFRSSTLTQLLNRAQSWEESIDHMKRSGHPDARLFTDRLELFASRYGAMGSDPWQASEDSWGTNRSLLFEQIQTLGRFMSQEHPSERRLEVAAQREEFIKAARKQFSLPMKRVFDSFLDSAEYYLRSRERSRWTVLEMTHIIRRLGHTIMAKLRQSDPSLPRDMIWYCFENELVEFIRSPRSFFTTYQNRKAARTLLASLEPPEVFSGSIPRVSEWRPRGRSIGSQLHVGETVSGEVSCHGVVEGVTRRLSHWRDSLELKPGEIIISHQAHPGWLHLATMASAVVVRNSGILGQISAVTREFGVPTLVGVEGADSIPDGARVRVDANEGIVRVLDRYS